MFCFLSYDSPPIRCFLNCDFEALLRNTALSEYNRGLMPQTTIELRSTQTLLCTCPDRAYINNIRLTNILI